MMSSPTDYPGEHKPPRAPQSPEMHGRSKITRSTSEDHMAKPTRTRSRSGSMTSSDGEPLKNSDPIEVMSRSLSLAQTRARKADETLRDYDAVLEAAVEEAVEWAAPPSPEGSTHDGTASAWQTITTTGLLGFLRGEAEDEVPAPQGGEPTGEEQEIYERTKVVLEMERFLQRTLCWRAANRAGQAGVSAASKLARSSVVRSRQSEEWNETERMGAFVLVAARLDAERVANKAEREAEEARQQTVQAKQQLKLSQRCLNQTQRALVRASSRIAAMEAADEEKRSDALSDPARPPHVSLQWAYGVVCSYLSNQNVSLQWRVSVATITAAAALWLCRGVFVMCRGIWRWGMNGLKPRNGALEGAGGSIAVEVTRAVGKAVAVQTA